MRGVDKTAAVRYVHLTTSFCLDGISPPPKLMDYCAAPNSIKKRQNRAIAVRSQHLIDSFNHIAGIISETIRSEDKNIFLAGYY